MHQVINYIKDFHVSKLGLTSFEALMILLSIALLLMAIHWISIYLPYELSKTIKNVTKWITLFLSYGLLTFVILNEVLNENYWNLLIIALVMISSRIGRWIRRYDKFIDSKIEKLNKK